MELNLSFMLSCLVSSFVISFDCLYFELKIKEIDRRMTETINPPQYILLY